jgi:hypothetical protein
MGLKDKPSIPRVGNLLGLKDKPSISRVSKLFVLFLELLVYN